MLQSNFKDLSKQVKAIFLVEKMISPNQIAFVEGKWIDEECYSRSRGS